MSVGRAALVAAIALAAPSALRAQPKSSAEEHREAGYAHVERGEWDDAVYEYEAAYALDHDPVSLYAIGKVHAQAGDCKAAVTAFRRFLDTGPPPRARASAEAEIAKCKDAIGDDTVTPPPDGDGDGDGDSDGDSDGDDGDGTDDVVEPPPPMPPPPRGPTPFYKDVLGDALVGGGLIAGGLGFYLYSQARSAPCTDPCTGSYADFVDSMDHARDLRTGAIVAWGVGAGLIATGVVRWVTVHRRADDAVSVGVAPATGGGSVIFAGRF